VGLEIVAVANGGLDVLLKGLLVFSISLEGLPLLEVVFSLFVRGLPCAV
jgi:hypothetical protein